MAIEAGKVLVRMAIHHVADDIVGVRLGMVAEEATERSVLLGREVNATDVLRRRLF